MILDASAPYLAQVSIYWDPLALISWLQTLLQDTYRDAGDGRTPVREIVQNADDAKAKRLVFAALDEGASSACNTLLSGPALLAANDGPFSDQDKTALHKAVGGSKTGDAEKIGRFGIGLKSVFHLCEAFVYLGAEGGTTKPGVLNPWIGTGAVRDRDPLHPDWDTVHNHDQRILLDVARAVLGSFDDGLLLWIPLRLREHFNRAPNGGKFGLVTNYPTIEEVAGWFDQPASLALLLAQCGHLDSIKAVRAKNLGQLDNPRRLLHLARPDFNSRTTWVGRHRSDSGQPNNRDFHGKISDGGAGWSVIGVDALGLASLSSLTSDPDWPRDHYSHEGAISLVPRKALAHAAITVLHRQNNGLAGVRIRWAVFLPLDDDPQPDGSEIVDTVGLGIGSDSWDIVIHGYFWPSQDRRSVPGATNDDNGGAGRETRMRALWNRTLRDEMLLPLLPQVLARAAQQVPDAAWKLVKDVADSNTVHNHRESVTESHALLPVITATGVQWQAVAAGASVLWVPAWMDAPDSVREAFEPMTPHDGLIFIAKDAPRIGGNPGPWLAPHITLLLKCISPDTLQTPEGLDWTANFVQHVLGQHGAGNGRSGAVARWLADMLAKGALTAAPDLRSAWERLSARLRDWVIYTPVESRDAVVELATAGVLGEGLLPIPIGRRTRNDPLRDQDKLYTALRVLGEGNDDTRRSRLLLAEDLLSVRDSRELTDDLARLPLLRAHRFPDDQDVAWSVNDMRRAIKRHRVFARSRDDRARQAVISVANALDDACWLVGPVPASLAEVPGATTGALANAVLATDTIRSNPNQRIGLLHRLAEDHDRHTRRALRVLLTAEPAAAAEGARNRNLYYVRDDDGERELNRTTLKILLRLRAEKWREVPPVLVARLRTDLVNCLRVNAADTPGVLQDLLDETLTTDAGWDQLQPCEVLHLLERLHGVKPEHRQRWRDMPLHRDVDGNRGRIDDRARVAGKLDLPDELRNENIRLLDPDHDVINLYSGIQSLNREGILCTMLRDERPHRFVKYILDDLTRREPLPDNTELLELLTNSRWLPTCDGGSGLAPAKLIYLTEDLLPIVQPLATALGGEYRLPNAVLPNIWVRAQRTVHEVLGCPNPPLQLQRFAHALNPTKVAEIDDGAFLILPLGDQLDCNLIQDALDTPLARSHHGWKIVKIAADVVGLDDNAVVEIARALRGPVPTQWQKEALKLLAEDGPFRDASDRMYRCLLHSFANTDDFFNHVLPDIKVPTQDGGWHSPKDVARSPLGVAPRHRLLKELYEVFSFDTNAQDPGAEN